MVFTTINKMLPYRKDCNYLIAKQLSKILLEEELLLEDLINKDHSRLNIKLWLSALYLFNFNIVMELNSINIKKGSKDDIFKELSNLLLSNIVKASKVYNNDQLSDLLSERTDKLIQIYKEGKEEKTKFNLKMVNERLTSSLSRSSGVEEDIYRDRLFKFSTRNITLIQDFLISKTVRSIR